MATIAFRFDAGPSIGSGHLIRCTALAEALRTLEHQILFLCRNPLSDPPPYPVLFFAPPLPVSTDGRYEVMDIIDELSAIQTLIPERQIDCLIVDHYGAGEAYFSALQGCVGLLVALDDTHRHPIPVDLVVNGNIYAERLSYPEASASLIGPWYLPLRKTFQSVTPRPISPRVRKVYLTSGGADPLRFCKTALEWLLALPQDHIQIHLIAGPGFSPSYLQKMKERAPELHICRQPDMRQCMEDADLFITSAGSTLYELAVCGVPNLSCILADNQVLLAAEMQQRGCTICLGRLEEVKLERATEALCQIIQNTSLRRKMRRQMHGCIFSFGATATANYLHLKLTYNGRAISKSETFSSPHFTYRGITFDDSFQLSAWRSNQELIKYFQNPKPESLEMQEKWFCESYMQDGRRYDFLVLDSQSGKPVGFVGASHINYAKGKCYIGYTIAEASFRGKHLSSELVSSLLQFLARSLGIHTYFAVVHKDNVPSQRLVSGLSFFPIYSDSQFITYQRVDTI